MRRVWTSAAVALLLGCGAEPTGQSTQAITPERPASYGEYSCTPGVGTPPPAKLVMHRENGIAGQYVVVLLDTVPDTGAAARTLASKYGGAVGHVYTAALHGFSIRLDDARAPLLAADPLVCAVEQDVPVHAAAE